jgi:cold-inducible RNA-binding protein
LPSLRTATSLSINLKVWCPSTGAFSPGVNGDAPSIVGCAVGLREQAIKNITKPLIDLSVDCVRWEPFSKNPFACFDYIERKSMSVKLYVGNLTFNTTEQDLQEQFSQYGQVNSASIITDRDTGRSRGFAFIELESKESAQAAIEALNGKELDGRALTVNEAKPRENRGDRAGFRRGNFGGDNSRRY